MATTNKKAAKRVASTRENAAHLQTRTKMTDAKPVKADITIKAKFSDGQEKFIWEKAEPISGINQGIYRVDAAGAIMKINEYGLKSEFGWVHTMINPEGEMDDVNNICAMHWANAKVKRQHMEQWTAKVTGEKLLNDLYNYEKEIKVAGDLLSKLRKTNIFDDKLVGKKKINTIIRKDARKR